MLSRITNSPHIKSIIKRTLTTQTVVPEQLGIERIAGGVLNLVLSPLHLLGNGFVTVKPMHVGVATYFGKYSGQHFKSGLHWIPTPIGTTIKSVYMGGRSTDFKNSKITDKNRNPIVVSGMMNYNVVDPAQYLYGTNDQNNYIFNQAESVLKQVVSGYTYDELSNTLSDIDNILREESQKKLDIAGIEVTKFSLTDMNYAPEIASAMLVRQQADAYIQGRKEITKGTCDIVDDIVDKYGSNMNDEQKSKLINNLMVSIISNSGVQQVINVV